MDMKRIVVFVLSILMILALSSVAFASSPVDTYEVSKTVGAGEEITVDLKLLDDTKDWRGDYKVRYDFTSGTKGYNGSGFIDSVKIDKNNKLVMTLKRAHTLTEEREMAGEVILTNKEDDEIYYTVEYYLSLHNSVVMVYGVPNSLDDDVQFLFPSENTVFVCDEESPGYAIFKEELLTGIIKFDAEEKVYLNVVYDDEDVGYELYELLGADLYEDNIMATYTFVGNPKFNNPVELSLIADYKDAYYLYSWDGVQLTSIEPTFDTVEGELEWKDDAPKTIVLSKTNLFVSPQPDSSEKKNPNTGAAAPIGVILTLVSIFLLIIGAILAKKKK